MYLSHLSYHLASQVKSIQALSALGEIPAGEASVYEKIMGLQCVPREPGATYYNQLTIALKKLFNEYPINPSSVKYLFFSHTGDYVEPWGFNVLQKIAVDFKFKNALSFSSTINKCASGFHFINLSNKLFFRLNDDDIILLLISDIAFTTTLQHIPGSTVLGDAATAIVLKKLGEYHHLIDVLLDVQDEFSRGLWGNKDEKLLFQSRYVKSISALIMGIIHKNNLSLSQIKCIFPHNVNTISWKQVAHELLLSPHQIYLDNIARTAHCFGSDPFLNLKDGVENSRILPGDYYLLVTMGLGATFGAMLFQY